MAVGEFGVSVAPAPTPFTDAVVPREVILTVTLNPAVDYTVEAPDLAAGAVTRAGTHRYDVGGPGINVSGYLAALGAETGAVAALGGFTGEYVREQLAAAPYETAVVDIEGQTRLNATVLAGDRSYKLNQQGPELGGDVLAAVAERVRAFAPDHLVVGGSLPPGIDGGAIDRLAGGGDWATTLDVPGEILGAVEGEYALCKPNREELRAATGRPVGTVEECRLAARRLTGRGFGQVLASLDADGAVLVTDEAAFHAPALEEPADAAGAGDALLAGYLGARTGGAREALRAGIVAAAGAAGVEGTAPPERAALEEGRERVAVRRLD